MHNLSSTVSPAASLMDTPDCPADITAKLHNTSLNVCLQVVVGVIYLALRLQENADTASGVAADLEIAAEWCSQYWLQGQEFNLHNLCPLPAHLSLLPIPSNPLFPPLPPTSLAVSVSLALLILLTISLSASACYLASSAVLCVLKDGLEGRGCLCVSYCVLRHRYWSIFSKPIIGRNSSKRIFPGPQYSVPTLKYICSSLKRQLVLILSICARVKVCI